MDSVDRRETFVLPNEMSIDEWEKNMFSAEGPLPNETEENIRREQKFYSLPRR